MARCRSIPGGCDTGQDYEVIAEPRIVWWCDERQVHLLGGDLGRARRAQQRIRQLLSAVGLG